ncbi:MAG: UvrD-helicase domain-containing protein [Lentimicrobium sp.]|nr:UvrD-helicase domain-containing protein [Lentimicrobium sp.]
MYNFASNNFKVADLLNELNEAQQQAVINSDGPVMVIAGAGSGKTRVLTYRIAWMLQNGVDPFNVLALTFTNKAAREMKSRITSLIGNEARNVWMGTFHSIFARILRIEGHLLGYPSSFTIYDTDDSKNLIKNILKDLNLDPKLYIPGAVLARISASKANLVSAEEYSQNADIREQDRISNRIQLAEIFLQYKARCFRAAAMDFDDLLFNTNLLLRDFPEVLYKYQEKFRYILVDEYQDTNHAQYLIIKKLAARYENICVVGDDAQSIYAFRGANIRNILNFKQDYKDARTYKLEQNYRSTRVIVNAANSVIDRNKDQIKKIVWTENDEGNPIKIIKASSDVEEGSKIADSIFEKKMNLHLQNNDFAILYRTNAQSRALEESLRRLNIPYRIYGGLSFYKRKEIKDLIAYFRLVVNPKDDEAFNRIINYPARGIGKTTLDKLESAAMQHKMSLFEIAADCSRYVQGLNYGTLTRIADFVNMISGFQQQVNQINAYELGMKIARKSGLLKELSADDSEDGHMRLENTEELLNALKDFSEKEQTLFPNEETGELTAESLTRTLDLFLQEVSLLTDADSDDDDNNKVVLMTIHAAKGLEFPFVFVAGLEENLFPSVLALNSRTEIEEERRLFYVAITRAQKEVTLSYAETRYRWGNMTMNEPSRFLEDIDESCIEKTTRKVAQNNFPGKPLLQKRTMFIKKVPNGTPESSSADKGPASPPELIQPGIFVEHERFGRGKVISVEGNGPNTKAIVFFNGVGQKQLLLKFAKLRLVE